jgi:hypothetical protein
MLGRMIRVLPLITILICTAARAAGSVEVISAEDWARPRTGESLVELPALQRTVRNFLAQTGGRRIVIHHPRGEEGVLWAEELRGWLVALGIPFDDIVVSDESSRIDAIELAVSNK